MDAAKKTLLICQRPQVTVLWERYGMTARAYGVRRRDGIILKDTQRGRLTLGHGEHAGFHRERRHRAYRGAATKRRKA